MRLRSDDGRCNDTLSSQKEENVKDIIFGQSTDYIRMLIIGPLSYIFLILFIRVAGKRTLSKMNAFDLIITVSLGSTFATVILNNSITLFQGMTALLLLILLQYLVTFTSVRSKTVSRLIKSEPALLYYEGKFLEKNMKKERVVKDEMDQFLRIEGYSSYEKISAVILETDGSLSVLSSDGKLITKGMAEKETDKGGS